MALIEISNLNPAGSELFAGTESFLTEINASDSGKIFGGGKKKSCGRKKPKGCGGYGGGSGSGGGSGGGSGSGGGCYGGGHSS
ncbi:MAG: hypothetical protein HC778_08500 [Chamaesiphon sp. CSU_1_12]|nr:hypothetical protein [Chamaesiphon sp. CSU_1_12]